MEFNVIFQADQDELGMLDSLSRGDHPPSSHVNQTLTHQGSQGFVLTELQQQQPEHPPTSLSQSLDDHQSLSQDLASLAHECYSFYSDNTQIEGQEYPTFTELLPIHSQTQSQGQIAEQQQRRSLTVQDGDYEGSGMM